jgi:nitrite transporter NirC
MPVPVPAALQAQEEMAVETAAAVRRRMPQFVVSAMLAGAFVGVAVVLLISVTAPMVAAGSSGAKLAEAAVFGIALTLVVFAGGELFTGVVMVMLQGLLRRTVRVTDVLATCAAAWAGNLVGSVAFAKAVDLSGVLSAGAPKGRTTAQLGLLAGMIQSKAALTASQLFFRGVLCNFLVCLGLWMAARAASDAAKLICLWWALLAFIGSGFEHCVANMTVFALAIFEHVPGATATEMGRNLLLTTLGNVVGGGLLVGVAYSYLARPTKEPVADAEEVYPTEPPVPAQATPKRTRTTTPPARR